MNPVPPKDGDPRLDAEIRQVAEARSRRLSGHPSSQELVDYHLGALSPEEADSLQEHLIYCRECARAVLDLAAFSRPAAGEPGPSVDLAREWERLQARLDAEESRSARPPSSRGLVLALAASLLLTIGLSGWNLRLRQGLEEARGPSTDFTVAHLAPEDPEKERSMEEPTLVPVRPGQDSVLLFLGWGGIEDFPRYRIVLMDPGKDILWQEADAPRHDDGYFLFQFSAEKLELKSYEARLYGEQDGKSHFLAHYSFELRRSEDATGGP